MGNEEFTIKGRPGIKSDSVKDDIKESLETLLKQKLEEVKQRLLLEKRTVVAYPGSEFKPENMPYIPDSTHPALFKHTLATEERNAGYQDMSQVPKEFAGPVLEQRKRQQMANDIRRVMVPSSATVTIEVVDKTEDKIQEDFIGLSSIDELLAQGAHLQSEGSYPQTCPQEPIATLGKEPEFKIGVSRENMHKGGFYMPNESRPYRPGG